MGNANEYGTRQADFSMLGSLGQAEVISECHALALMMDTARTTLRGTATYPYAYVYATDRADGYSHCVGVVHTPSGTVDGSAGLFRNLNSAVVFARALAGSAGTVDVMPSAHRYCSDDDCILCAEIEATEDAHIDARERAADEVAPAWERMG